MRIRRRREEKGRKGTIIHAMYSIILENKLLIKKAPFHRIEKF